MIGYLALAITAIIIVSVLTQIDNWQRDWTTNFSETDETSADPLLRPIVIEKSPDEVAERLRQWVAAERRWEWIEESQISAGARQIHLLRRTPLFRFVDDIQVTIFPAEEGSLSRTRVTASSRSRVGKGDLGQNPRNLKMVLAALQAPAVQDERNESNGQ